ncbi:hypothetical protein ColKHC_09076 [Colletotrichum higginsianum]|nr:hypothetical protein ColKHC_09076 [Colletotrichum higginsianum]
MSDVETPQARRGLTTTDGCEATTLATSAAATTAAATPKKQRLEKHPHSPSPSPRRERSYSFSPGRKDSIRVAGQTGSGPPVPGRLAGPFPADRNDGEEKGDPDAAWERAPTLHNNARHHGQHQAASPAPPSRRKTNNSKRRRTTTATTTTRRAETTDREADIKAMTHFAPVRPAADTWTSGRPIRKQSKRLKTGLGFHGNSFDNPQSDVSLPMSIHSSMSSDTELHSFRVSALEILAPRPTLRYAVYPRWEPGSGSAPTRTQQQKRKVSERVPESVVRAHKRVDSFADDLDAADLRELMERDNRRRERKRQRDQERVERRLARRAERHREMEAEARNSGSPPPVNMERGVMGREAGLGIDAPSAVVTSSRRRSWSSSRHSQKISTTREAESHPEPHPEPMEVEPEPVAFLHHFHRTTSIPPEAPPSPTLPAQPVPERKPSTKAATPKGSMRLRRSFLRRMSRSRSPNATESDQNAVSQYSSRQDESDVTPRKNSESSSRARISFSALFRLGKRNRRNSGPSSFSNTSRFREDLPELPMSPPDSRVGSPEVEVPLPVVSESRSGGFGGDDGLQNTPVVRHDTPTSDLRRVDEKMERLEKMRQTPTSLRHSIQPSPEPVSLASIDSEGSWLSGRVGGARRSSGLRGSMQRLPPRITTRTPSPNGTEEDLADDEYLSNLATPSREMLADERLTRKSTGDAFPSSDEDEVMAEAADMKWGSVERQHATVVQHPRITSRVGMLNSFHEAGSNSSTSSESPEEASESEVDGESPKVQRATSVSLSRGNARHVSSGSTKALDVSSPAQA